MRDLLISVIRVIAADIFFSAVFAIFIPHEVTKKTFYCLNLHLKIMPFDMSQIFILVLYAKRVW